MVLRSTARRRRSGGFTLLVALGVVAVVTMAVMMSYRVVGREADTQADTRRSKEAFFAAEAGLAEAREAMRLRLAGNETYSAALGSLGTTVNTELGLGTVITPWYEVLPGRGREVSPGVFDGDGWNYLGLTTGSMDTDELRSGPGTGSEPYVDYPVQSNVRYRVFARDDVDETGSQTDAPGTQDRNGRVWLVAVGEVTNAQGRPTRAIVQALITNENVPVPSGPGCVNRGCGPDNTFNNTQDQSAPNTGTTLILPRGG